MKDPIVLKSIHGDVFWKKKYEFEKSKRLEAERLLEVKSLELYHAKLKLTEKLEELEEAKTKLGEAFVELECINTTLEELVLSKTEEIRLKNSRILDSINYARRIQQSILPKESLLETLFSDYFVINRPKDIVSGDFYWVSEGHNIFGENNYVSRDGLPTVFVLMDCTGHGVPGSFISLLAYSWLRHIVHFMKIYEPSQILARLNTAMSTALGVNSNGIADGMDMGICSIYHGQNKLIFSGARHPLICASEDGIKIIPGVKRSIGDNSRSDVVPFIDHHIPLDKTNFYMLSDGYQDQFGGKSNRKFRRKWLYSLIERFSIYPMVQQKRILEYILKNWQNQNEQTDDILVVGFEA